MMYQLANMARPHRRLALVALVTLVATASCGRFQSDVGSADGGRRDASPAPTASDMTPSTTATVSVTGADSATALTQSRDGRLFFAERAGRIRYFKDGKTETFAQVEVSDSGERGLLGLALHPDFPATPLLYAFVSPSDDESISRIIRFTEQSGRGTEMTVLVELPAGGGCCHKGGRIAFGPDKKLYVSVGDNQSPRAAAKPDDLRGKILRYEPDGSPAAGNPFGDANPAWAIGLRNPFGMRFAPDATLWVTDNGPSGNDGPSCCDEVDRVERGGNYGWPEAWGDRGKKVGIQPVWTSGNTVYAPTGLTVLATNRLPALRGAIAFCSYTLGVMTLITESGAPWPTGFEKAGEGPRGCALDVTEGTDGYVYFSDEAMIYRIG